MTQKMIRVRTRVSAISRRHPIAGFRVTREGSGWSQVRQYRSSGGIDPRVGRATPARGWSCRPVGRRGPRCQRFGVAVGRFVGAGVAFLGLAVGLAEGLAEGAPDAPGAGLASSGCWAVGRISSVSIGQYRSQARPMTDETS